jgi:subtilisin family serine protease
MRQSLRWGPVTVDGSARTKPDLLAPGVDVLSAAPNDGYMISSGTSAAGPHVAGVVALMWSANPALIGDIERTQQILVETTIPFTGSLAVDILPLTEPCPLNLETIPNNAAGYGILNAYAAVQRALEIAE